MVDQVRPRLRGRLHAVAAGLSVVALIWLVRSATSAQAVAAAWVYGGACVLCYLMSAVYHVVRTERARALFRRADHAMIYVLIAGTFTPICLLAMGEPWRWVICAVVWAGALVGIVLSVAAKPRLARFRVALYLILGWTGLATLPALSDRPFRAVLVVAAGLLYTVGAILFGRKRPTLRPDWFGYHEFWHGIGLAAGVLLFVVNLSLIAAPSP